MLGKECLLFTQPQRWERACSAPTCRGGFTGVELQHLAGACVKFQVTCGLLLLVQWVFYMAI